MMQILNRISTIWVTALLTLLLIGQVRSQTQFNYTGVGAFRGHIELEDLELEPEGYMLSWHYSQGNEYRGHFGMGMATYNILDTENAVALKSGNSFAWYFDLTRTVRWFYCSTGINFYNVSGISNLTLDATASQSEVILKYKNSYKLYEFPVSYGIQLNFGRLVLHGGYRQHFYFGKQHSRVYLQQLETDDLKISDENLSFTDNSDRFREVGVSLYLGQNYYLNVLYGALDKGNEFMSLMIGVRL